MTEFWDKPAEKLGKVLAAFQEGQPLLQTLPTGPKRSVTLEFSCKKIILSQKGDKVREFGMTSRQFVP